MSRPVHQQVVPGDQERWVLPPSGELETTKSIHCEGSLQDGRDQHAEGSIGEG